MHASVIRFFLGGGALTVAEVEGKDVIEVGACDVNGSVRPIVETLRPASYLGVDAAPGPRVDRVLDCARLVEELGESFDVCVSTEMLEHVDDWRASVRNLAGVLRPGGLLVVTTRSIGFPYHPFPVDNWRYSVDGFGEILDRIGLDAVLVEPDPGYPGVFAKARRPEGWVWPGDDCLDDVDGVTRMVPA